MRKLVWTWGSAPTTKRMKVKVQVFPPMSEIFSESSFFLKSYIIIVQKIILERFGPYKKSKKVDFPLYFKKWIWPI